MRQILIAILLFTLCACSNDENTARQTEAAPVRVASVIRESTPRVLEAVGNVRASASVGLVPRVAGEIVAINFTEGQDVKEGQPLIQIDPRPYETALREKRGLLAKSEAQFNKAVEDRKRYGKLVHNGYVSREAFDQTATDAAALRATVLSDRANVESAALDLSYCTLKAPIDGRIGALKVDKGNMVKSNASEPIVTIDTFSPCYVTFSVPESNLAAIQKEMDKGPVTLTATPTGGETQTGVLTLVDNNVDVKTGTIRLRGTFPNNPRYLWPGQFVEVSLPLGSLENAIIVPSRAVQAGRDESYVYVADDDNRAQYHKVRVLFQRDGKSVLECDLQPGQKVITEGQIRLAPGLPVRILD